MKNLYWGSSQLPPQQGGVHHGHCDQDEVELSQGDLVTVCQREWAWWPSWCWFEIDFQNCWWPESHEIAYWKILAGDGNEQQDGLSAIRGLLLKNWRYTATSVQGSTRTSEHFSTRMQIFLELTTIFFHPTIKLWRSRRWPAQTTLLLKDGIVLLGHEACQEQPLNILDTFKKRNPPNLYYRMTYLVVGSISSL